MSRIDLTKQIFVSAEEAIRLVGGLDRLSDLALRGVLGFYVQVHQSSASISMARPWEDENASLLTPEVSAQVKPDPRFDGDTHFQINGWFRASRLMIDELLSSQEGGAHESVDAWDEQGKRWHVLSTLGRRHLEEMRLLYADLLDAGFVHEDSRSSGNKVLDVRERKSLLLIIGALARMIDADRRGSSASVSKYMLDVLLLESPKEATVRKYLKEAEKMLAQLSPKQQ